MNKNPKTIGETLAEKRMSLELETKDAADEIQAPKKFIEALEQNDYGIFPAKIYALGFLRKYVKFLGFDGETADKILKEFSQEWEVITFKKNKEIKKIPEIRENVFILTPRKIVMICGLLIFLTITGYFIYQLRYLGSPGLVINIPSENYFSENQSIEISGFAEKNSDLTINGRTIYIGENGLFKDSLNLASGLNTLEFRAVNKFGKETKIIRHVLVKKISNF